MNSLKVAYQGIPGAFSDIAIKHYWKSKASGVPTKTFPELFKTVETKKADFAMVPLENSLAGSVVQNYDLLNQSEVQIIGELYLRIQHHLLVIPQNNINPKERLKTLTKVYSHPVALAQCQAFFKKHPWLTPANHEDTAGSAKDLATSQSSTTAAIASQLAAKLYGLQTLVKNTETNQQNYTRFVVIAKKANSCKTVNKISLIFNLPHQPGALYSVLKPIKENGLNLTKIESRPLIGRPWEYRFYLDIEHPDIKRQWQRVKKDFSKHCLKLKVLGIYRKGKAYEG